MLAGGLRGDGDVVVDDVIGLVDLEGEFSWVKKRHRRIKWRGNLMKAGLPGLPTSVR